MRVDNPQTTEQPGRNMFERVDMEVAADDRALTIERLFAGAAKDLNAGDSEMTGDPCEGQIDATMHGAAFRDCALDADVALDVDTLSVNGEFCVFSMTLRFLAPAVVSGVMVAGGDAEAFDGEVATDVGCLEGEAGEVDLVGWCRCMNGGARPSAFNKFVELGDGGEL